MAAPFTAATTGWCSFRIVVMTSSRSSIARKAIVGTVRPSMFGTMPESSWSAPEQKPCPAPVTTTTRVELSLPTLASSSRKGIITSNAIAFIRSGRFSVINATPSCGRDTSTNPIARAFHISRDAGSEHPPAYIVASCWLPKRPS
jgi:hypothetical protein